MSKEIPIDRVEEPTTEDERLPETPDDVRPATAARHDLPSSKLLFPKERQGELREAWLEIQSSFIDEPQGAVRKADGLVKEVLTTVSERFESARRDLEAEWDRGEEVSTEALRLALQHYRALFDRLLTL